MLLDMMQLEKLYKHMKKMIKLNFYVKSNHWSRRLNKIKMIVNQVIKEKYNLNFDMKKNYYLNIILINN